MGTYRREFWGIALLPWPHVQFWEAENCWRLDSSHNRRHDCHTPDLVDAPDVRTVNGAQGSSGRDQMSKGFITKHQIGSILPVT